jgi:hypothetical protein
MEDTQTANRVVAYDRLLGVSDRGVSLGCELDYHLFHFPFHSSIERALVIVIEIPLRKQHNYHKPSIINQYHYLPSIILSITHTVIKQTNSAQTIHNDARHDRVSSLFEDSKRICPAL